MKNDIDFNKYGKNFNAKEIIVMLNAVKTFRYNGRLSRAGGNLNATYKPSQSITIIFDEYSVVPNRVGNDDTWHLSYPLQYFSEKIDCSG